VKIMLTGRAIIVALSSTIVGWLVYSTAAADEGMWTFDHFPTAKMQRDYGFAPTRAWLDHVRLSSPRLTDRCSSSLVSAEGLVLSNHHCVIDCVQDLTYRQTDIVAHGFLASDRSNEVQCPDQQAEVLESIEDVTGAMQAAIGRATADRFSIARDGGDREN
jgi:hypothetical protein